MHTRVAKGVVKPLVSTAKDGKISARTAVRCFSHSSFAVSVFIAIRPTDKCAKDQLTLVNGMALSVCAGGLIFFFSPTNQRRVRRLLVFQKQSTRRIKMLTPRRSPLHEEEAKLEGADI